MIKNLGSHDDTLASLLLGKVNRHTIFFYLADAVAYAKDMLGKKRKYFNEM